MTFICPVDILSLGSYSLRVPQDRRFPYSAFPPPPPPTPFFSASPTYLYHLPLLIYIWHALCMPATIKTFLGWKHRTGFLDLHAGTFWWKKVCSMVVLRSGHVSSAKRRPDKKKAAGGDRGATDMLPLDARATPPALCLLFYYQRLLRTGEDRMEDILGDMFLFILGLGKDFPHHGMAA